MASSDSDDEIPLAVLQTLLRNENITTDTEDDESMLISDYDSDKDPEFQTGICEVRRCKGEVWAACHNCEILVCWDHFMEDVTSCREHGKTIKKQKKTHTKSQVISENNKVGLEEYNSGTVKNQYDTHPQQSGKKVEKERTPQNNEIKKGYNANISVVPENSTDTDIVYVQENISVSKESQDILIQRESPGDYTVEGAEKEVQTEKKKKINKQKDAKKKRQMGKEYTSIRTKKVIPAKKLKPRCKGDTCAKQSKKCLTITDEHRQAIFESYHSLGDIQVQRDFIATHVKVSEVKRKYCKGNDSRRNHTISYTLLVEGSLITVCKTFFLNTFGISEQIVKTALAKVTATGTIEKDRRGGIQSKVEKERNESLRQEISDHIDKFPRVESHYCREKTTREYLSPELTKRLMYNMFIQSWIPRPRPPSRSTYYDVFKGKNISLHRPKKDQCSLCICFREGSEETKQNLGEKYESHIQEKMRVRELKNICKNEALKSDTTLCASFDLQQVIYLPISNESKIFYKRRLSLYNLTIYDIGTKDCHCYTWDETQSRRGSSEISTCVWKALKLYDEKGIKKAYLFSDGCSGQNKNSITPAMMLHTVKKSVNIEEISLRFFETNHGQNEGDSAHSAIGYALKNAGNVFLPSQVSTVMSLARPSNPYIVTQMQFQDFLDFKGLSKDLRIIDAGREEGFTWNSIMELKVLKKEPNKFYYKTSHLQSAYKEYSLKRISSSVGSYTPKHLNEGVINISKLKYDDLISLCSGPTPVVKLEEHKKFYMAIPHDTK